MGISFTNILPIYHESLKSNPKNVILRWINDILNKNISLIIIVCEILARNVAPILVGLGHKFEGFTHNNGLSG